MQASVQPMVEPQPSAPIEAWRSWIRELIHAGLFTGRIWSWVCVGQRYFLKIPRVSGGRLDTDFSDGAAEADRECRLTQSLAEQLEGMVDTPLRLIDGCIVKRRLTGPDLWTLAKREGATAQVRQAVSEGVMFAARLHGLDPARVPGLMVHDYANDPYLPAPEELHDRLRQRRPTIVVSGLDVRNFKQDRPDGQWLFFDPHTAEIGVPEDDFARYILSLLMINWGRHADCRIWTKFDYCELVDIYEKTGGAPLDRALLTYMFARNVARVRSDVWAVGDWSRWLRRAAARAYEKLFFWQVMRWGGQHGL
jgi:hypothetical protein